MPRHGRVEIAFDHPLPEERPLSRGIAVTPKGFSIIIPTYNRAELLRKALESIQALRVPEGWQIEVLVVDNNCTDHTAEVVEEAARTGPLKVRRIVEMQLGLNHGRNRGMAEARFEQLVYLDDDMQVAPGWLEGYVEAHERFCADCVVGPVEPCIEGEIPDWMSPRILQSVTSAYSRKSKTAMLLGAEQGHEVPGCNFAVTRTAALEVGGFHPGLDRSGANMLAGGDWEFAARLVLRKKRIVYVPLCQIRHFISNAKLSKDSLRKRWTGLGATQRTLTALRGERPSLARQARLFLRANRFFLRSSRLRLSGNDREAFRWELEARRIWGFLITHPNDRAIRPSEPSNSSKTRSLADSPGGKSLP